MVVDDGDYVSSFMFQSIYNPHQWTVTGCYDVSNIQEASEV